MPNAIIETLECTLFYDYDCHRDNIFPRLSDAGKVTWFEERMKMVFLNPLSILFDRGSNAFLQLESPVRGSSSTISLIATSVLMNGIEALGSFLVTGTASNKAKFFAFMQAYMPDWCLNVKSPRHQNRPMPLAYLLWKAYRNGLTHCFAISGAGIDTVGGTAKYKTDGGVLQIDIWKFYADFQLAAIAMFHDIRQDPNKRRMFLTRFATAYACP